MFFKKLKLIFFIFSISKKEFKKISLSQKLKGIKKYGIPIENRSLYYADWRIEALEEIVDCYEYLKMLDKFKKSKK